MLQIAAAAHGFDLATPFEKLPEKIQNLLLYGDAGARSGKTGFRGILGYLKQNLEESTSESYREWLLDHMSATNCPAARQTAASGKPGGESERHVHCRLHGAAGFARTGNVRSKIKLNGREAIIAGRVVHEIVSAFNFWMLSGLGYISLDRSAATLSGGEGQRIRLATQIGSKLRGVLYVLDEPSIGFHHRDNGRLLKALENLRDLGNTVLVVEHDEETIRRADYVIDLGPGAGRMAGPGAHGTPEEIMHVPESLTGEYISGQNEDRNARRTACSQMARHHRSGREGKQSQESGRHVSRWA